MDASHKQLLPAFVDLLNLAIRRGPVEDAETLLACVRALQPRKVELDVYEALIAMRRGRRDDALRILRNLDDAAPQWGAAKGFLAYCQFLGGDSAWRDTAQTVLDSPQSSPQAIDMVRLLIDPPGEAAAPERAAPSDEVVAGGYMRA